MGLILDLAVAALALVVIGSLATLAWTLAVSAVRATAQARERVASRRRWVARVKAELPEALAHADAEVVSALNRTARPAGDTTEAETRGA